ncbi:uncharacterized protein [Halyomorpha halys]|uniref:uncharacterized protein n=1 Tax=Halyomorpha halys TaxID=286706 RepID=UPI0034D289A3
MLKLYTTIVCSKLDYGSFVYGSARRRTLAKLDSVHHTGIRLATGAFRTSPILSICSEAGLPPLSFRRQKLAIHYVSKLFEQTNHPTYKYIFRSKFSIAFRQKRNPTLPLAERITLAISTLKAIPIMKPEIQNPPWTLKQPVTMLHLSLMHKNKTASVKYKERLSRLLENIPDYFLIYTDGSKSETSTASSFVTHDSTHKFKLHKLCSVYTAELHAIASALHFCFSITQKTIVIISDSLSSLKSLRNMYPEHPLIIRIQSFLLKLSQQGKSIIFIWAPSHTGIVGNELADKAAREALTLPGRGTAVLTPSELSTPLKLQILEKWQAKWDESSPSKLKEIKRSVKPWSTSYRNSRREEVALARLRIGHTLLTHSHLIRKLPPQELRGNSCHPPVKGMAGL